mgnify:CR=1 FL=1|jgi:hypothetical protein
MKKQFILSRYSNEFTYLRGWLKLDNCYISDTLELGHMTCLPCGTYKLKVVNENNLVGKTVYICDNDLNVLSCFAGLNLLKYKQTWIREFNNYISLGVQSKHPLLSNSTNYLSYFSGLVNQFLAANYEVELLIVSERSANIELYDMLNEEFVRANFG